MSMLLQAAVCGRFQPLHNEHLDYILHAKCLTSRLWIGLVSPSPVSTSPSYRLVRSANPLTHDERARSIIEALDEAGVHVSDIEIVPFDIEKAQNIPVRVPMLITKCDPWSDKKEEMLRKNYNVKVLEHRSVANITGSVIREKILRGDSTWMSSVPRATVHLVERVNLRERLGVIARREASD